MFLIVLITIFSFSFYGHALDCDTVGEVPKVIKKFDPTYGRCITGYQDFYDFDIETVDQFCDCQGKSVPKMEDRQLFDLADKAYPLILDEILNFKNFILFINNLPNKSNIKLSCNLSTILQKNGCLKGKGKENFIEAFSGLLDDKFFKSSSNTTEQKIVDVLIDKIMYESESIVPNSTLSKVNVCVPIATKSAFYSRSIEVGQELDLENLAINMGKSVNSRLMKSLASYVQGGKELADLSIDVQDEVNNQCNSLNKEFYNLCTDIDFYNDKTINDDEIYADKLDSLVLDTDENVYESLVTGTAICENRKSNKENIYDFSKRVLSKDFSGLSKKAMVYDNYFEGHLSRDNTYGVCEAVCVEPKGPYPVEGCRKKDKDVVLKEMGCSVSMDLSTDLAKRCEYISSIYSADIKKEIIEIGERIAKVESGEAYINEDGEYVENSSSSDGEDKGAKSMLSEFLGVGRKLNEVDAKPAVALEGPKANEVARLDLKDTTSSSVDLNSSQVKSSPSVEYTNRRAVTKTDSRVGTVTDSNINQLSSSNKYNHLNVGVSSDTPKAQKVDTSPLNTHLNSLKQKLARINKERDEYKKIINSKNPGTNSSDGIFAGASLSSLNDSFSLGSPAAVGSSFNANIAPAGSNNFFNGRNNDTIASNTVDYNYQGPKRATNITGEQGLPDQIGGGVQRAVAQGDGTDGDNPQSVGLRNAISEAGGSPLAAGNLITKSSDNSLAPIARLFNNEISKAEVKVSTGGGEKVVVIDDDQIKATEINLVYLLRDRDDIQPGVDVIHIQYVNPDNQTVSVKLIPTKFDENFTGYTIDEKASERWLSSLLKAKANLIR